jgi:drug/metabolite transporter (DMT)-like permease
MPLTIILAGATAVLFGFSDFFGGLAARRDSEVTVTANAHLLGLLLLGAAALTFPGTLVSSGDLMWGAIAGVSGGVGVTALYGALARGRMSVVAPITAALSGSLPALYDLATGAVIRPLALAGLGVALVAIVIVSSVGHPEDRAAMPPAAIALSLLAGVGFAGSFLLFSLTAPASGFAPLVAARVVSVVLMGGLALVKGRGNASVAPDALAPSLGAGALDAAANITMITAIRIGPLAVASVLGSLYPVMTILLARVVLKERLHWAQRAGVLLALAALLMAGFGMASG